MKKSKKSPLRQKRTWLLGSILLIVAAVTGFAIITHIRDTRENTRRIEQLQQTDKDIQKFGDFLEQSFPGQVTRERYCRHDSDKFGPGALRCTTYVTIETKYTSEEKLTAGINKLNQITREQSWFKTDRLFTTDSKNAKVTTLSSVIFTSNATLMKCDASNDVAHFQGTRPEKHGEFEFYLGCTTKALQKPIYQLEDS